MADNSAMPWVGWALSIYGAVLSTLLAILHWRRDRGRFSISPEVLYIKLLDDKTIVWRLIEIVNAGRRPLYLDDFSCVRASGELESMRKRESDTHFPLKLEEGQKHRSMTIDDSFASHDIKNLWARDTTGTIYYSGAFPFGKDS